MYPHVICIAFILQEVLVWLTALQKEMGGEVSDEQMRDYIWNTLKSGRVKKTLLLHDQLWLFVKMYIYTQILVL